MSRSASESRYYEEQPCEHGNQGICAHMPIDHRDGGCFRLDCNVFHTELCPGGSRREITIDYRAAAIEWIGDKPPDNYPGEWEQMITSVIEQTVKPIIDAALGDTR